MPTIGELLESIRQSGLNAEPTGDSPFGGVAPGTNSPVAVPGGIDDLSSDLKSTLGEYLGKRTGGAQRLEESNAYPVDVQQYDSPGVDPATGTPPPLGNPKSFQKTYQNPTAGVRTGVNSGGSDPVYKQNMDDAFGYLDSLGFFDDLDDIDKNDQITGHTLLNHSKTNRKISRVLKSNRFNSYDSKKPFVASSKEGEGLKKYTPNNNYHDANGLPLDHPAIENLSRIYDIMVGQGVRPRGIFPRFDAADKSSTEFGKIKEEFNKPNPAYSEHHTPTTFYKPYSPDHKFENNGDIPWTTLAVAGLEAVKLALVPTTQLLNLCCKMENFIKGQNANAPGQRHSNSSGDQKSREPVLDDKGKVIQSPGFKHENQIYMMMSALSLPVPHHTINLLKAQDSGPLGWKAVVALGLTLIQGQIQGDATMMLSVQSKLNHMIRMLSPENSFGLPGVGTELMEALGSAAIGAALSAGAGALGVPIKISQPYLSNSRFMLKLKDCYAVSLIRHLIVMSEIVAQRGPNLKGALYPVSGYGDLSKQRNHAGTRLSNGGRYGGGLAARNVPSMMLLPAAFTHGQAKFLAMKKGSGTEAGDFSNQDTSHNFDSFFSNAAKIRLLDRNGKSLDDAKGTALYKKLGTPLNREANRFSREEVEAMENMLEAELLPFYFHDLRTNEIVSFHAFLNTLSDSFSPSYAASSGFGRVEDVQIYQKTSRAIAIDFTVMSMNPTDMQEMYYKLNKVVSMVYPQYSRGTLLELKGENGTTRFVQPFSQITTATPLIRLRVGDLIKSNYSREGMARLSGVDNDQFTINKADDGAEDKLIADEKAFYEALDIVHETLRKELGNAKELGVFADDTTEVMKRLPPPGSIVIVDLGYLAGAAYLSVGKVNKFDISGVNLTTIKEESIHQDITKRYLLAPKVAVEIVDYVANSSLADTAINPRTGLGGGSRGTGQLMMKVKLAQIDHPLAPVVLSLGEDMLTGDFLDEAMFYVSQINVEETLTISRAPGINQSYFETSDNPRIAQQSSKTNEDADLFSVLLDSKNPLYRSFETTMGRGLAGVITSLSFDWGLNSEIMWDLKRFNHKAPMGCKVSIAFTPIHDITPGLDHNGMMRAPVFNVANISPHVHDDPHDGYDERRRVFNQSQTDYSSAKRPKDT